jgi:hypothetical protein
MAAAEAAHDPAGLASAQTSLGRALVDAGHPAEARPLLEQALATREQVHAPALLRGRTRFTLARALAGGTLADRRRAIELAHAARADIEASLAALAPGDAFGRKWQQRRLDEVDRWLAQR